MTAEAAPTSEKNSIVPITTGIDHDGSHLANLIPTHYSIHLYYMLQTQNCFKYVITLAQGACHLG